MDALAAFPEQISLIPLIIFPLYALLWGCRVQNKLSSRLPRRLVYYDLMIEEQHNKRRDENIRVNYYCSTNMLNQKKHNRCMGFLILLFLSAMCVLMLLNFCHTIQMTQCLSCSLIQTEK